MIKDAITSRDSLSLAEQTSSQRKRLTAHDVKVNRIIERLMESESLDLLFSDVGMSKASVASEMGISREALIGAMNRGLSNEYKRRIREVLHRRANRILSFCIGAQYLKSL